MNKKILFSAMTIALFLCWNLSFGQQPINLGILTSFEAFTGAGGVGNGANASINGDVGTHVGAVSGLVSPSFTGNIYNANAETDQAKKDILRLYIHLNDKFVDYPVAGPEFSGTLTPGVYSTDGAGSLGATLTLDGGGDPNAFFIIKTNGALTVGAGAVVTLTNGTRSCNVFYIANGAISVAANATIKGTLFSKVGAVGLGVDVTLEGRMLTMDGAITVGVNSVASPPPCVSTIPIFCEAACSPSPTVDVLGVASQFALFTSLGAVANTGISGINGKVGSGGGAMSGYTNGVHIGTEHGPTDPLTIQAKLDLDAAYIALMALPNTVTDHPPAFGSVAAGGETITPGVYFVNGAGSLGGTIVLDAQNDPNAIFVFKFAGAFNVGALSKTILKNGAHRCNIFWIGGAGVTTGAINIGAASIVKGTFLSHGGACNSGQGVFLEGRQLSTGGAVNTNTGVLYTDPECITSTSLAPAPAVALVKTASVSGTGILGDVITYSFTVSNTGNTTLTNVVVTDPMVGLTITGSPIASLEVGASSSVITGTYTITQANINAGSVTNSATATSDEGATDISGTANDNDTATVTTITQTPAIALVKTASVSGTGILGDVITYTFTVTNTGNTTLTNILVTDPMVGLTISGNPITSLAAGASSSAITGTYTITQADIDAGGVTNSALAAAKDPNNNDVTDTSGTANDNNNQTVTPLTFSPAIDLVKTASVNGTGAIGNIITYIFIIKNIGNTSLTNILIADPMEGLTFFGNPIASLAPGAVAIAIATYTITQANIDTGSITNSASVIAKDPKGNDITDTSGTSNDSNTPTVTTTEPSVPVLPDFASTIDIGDLVFSSAGATKDFIVNISEINGAPSNGQMVLKIPKQSAFTITYEASTSISGSESVNNNDWMITEDPLFITVTLKSGVIIGMNSFSKIGFTIERKPNIPAQTSQSITVSIVNGSGLDSQSYNNTYSITINAQ